MTSNGSLRDNLPDLLTAWENAEQPAAALALRVLEAARGVPDLAEDGWSRFLTTTAHPDFLEALPDRAHRDQWAEIVFAAVDICGFTLADMLDWRVRTRGPHTYLHDLGQPDEPTLTFARVRERARQIAALLHGPTPDSADCPTAPGRPRVGILAENGLQSACCDLACLMHDILVAPLSVHEGAEELAWICERVGLTDLIVDDSDALERALEIRGRLTRPPRLHLLRPAGGLAGDEIALLEAELSALAPDEVDRRLALRPRFDLHSPCTVMFTSGSTGRPKCIAFSQYNLVTKRFARGAALPRVGRDETLLSYLPLYHTFGRYLELLGMLYWGGTYVFAGNPSAETLLRHMPRIRPTGLISIPLRWVQIRDRTLAALERDGSTDADAALGEVTGGRLRWGLSAAGYLDPAVFRFFQQHGVALCSGFGMTEGTGGLTMTPPDDYVEDSVGIPLPGVRTRLGEQNELQVAGPYVAPYLPEDGAPGSLEIADDEGEESWLSTGDLFEELPGGHLRIVDRIKDIYKNNRGQTIAPRKVESRFEGVPGIKRTFLAGDGRAYNTLLIVPDHGEPALGSLRETEVQEYFHRLVTQANLDLAPFERVVSFALLERDFSGEYGELTPKGSYRRKVITANFAPVLEELYRSNRRELEWNGRSILIPHWVFRDLGVLEDDIVTDAEGLVDQRSGRRLRLGPGQQPDTFRVGDLEYFFDSGTVPIDLGRFARQPALWVGNPALTAFLQCKDGWDTPLRSVTEHVTLPDRNEPAQEVAPAPARADSRLHQIDNLTREALFGPTPTSLVALDTLQDRLPRAAPREAALIRRRLEALANHPEQDIRCRAYRILVLHDHELDDDRSLQAFVMAGKSFLCEDTIAEIASSRLEARRLQGFRRRLHGYRQRLDWPASPVIRTIFVDLIQLLSDFARYQIEYYPTMRRELACWAVFDRDPELAAVAWQHLCELGDWYEAQLMGRCVPREEWAGRIAYQEGLEPAEIAKLDSVLAGTTFLQESVQLAYQEELDPREIPAAGAWVSRTISQPFPSRYRVSINTTSGNHYDLLVILRDDLERDEVMRTFFWVIAIRAYPVGSPTMPRFGCLRPDLGAVSLAFASELTVWDRIRDHARPAEAETLGREGWRKLFVRGMATVLAAWTASDRRIVPGVVSPSNVTAPEPDWRDDRMVISLAGWRLYRTPLDLVRPFLKNFVQLPGSHYPACRPLLDPGWILEAVAEALGATAAREFLSELDRDLAVNEVPEADPGFRERVIDFAAELAASYRVPLVVESAVERYRDWQVANPEASPEARIDQIEALARLYHLERYREPARFCLLRGTFFAEAPAEVGEAFDRLVDSLFRHPDLRAAQTVELSNLQTLMANDAERLALARLAFPYAGAEQLPAVTTVGDPARRHVILQTKIRDDQEVPYTVQQPRSPAEVGRLYLLFLNSGFPLVIGEQDRHLVVLDAREQVVAGLVYRLGAHGQPHVEGVAVASTMRGRGVARALLNDFCVRMAELGQTVVRTHFSLRSFFGRLGFQVDRSWGGLVRHLH